MPSLQNLVEASASHCQEKYGKERQQQREKALWEAKDEHGFVWEDMMDEEDEEGNMEDTYEMDEDIASMKVILWLLDHRLIYKMYTLVAVGEGI